MRAGFMRKGRGNWERLRGSFLTEVSSDDGLDM